MYCYRAPSTVLGLTSCNPKCFGANLTSVTEVLLSTSEVLLTCNSKKEQSETQTLLEINIKKDIFIANKRLLHIQSCNANLSNNHVMIGDPKRGEGGWGVGWWMG